MTRLRPLAALATLALIGAGCSNGSADNGNTGTAKTGESTATAARKLTAHDKAVKFAECMRANGVPHFPDPDPKGDYNFGVDVTREVWLKAVDACKELQPPER